jgi:predicted glycoside hydrolase/deacetylase ChbG (UPF0249 family)
MVTGGAADEGASLARETPGLAVGLHLALSRRDPIRAALRYYFHRAARRRLEPEVEAQFEAFARTGIELSHVDGHQHLHAHPAVLPVVIELAVRYGAHGIRIPRDPLWPNLRADRSRPAYKLVTALGQAYLSSVCRRLVRDGRLVTCDAVIGGLMSGGMTDSYVIEMLKRLDCRSIELYFHPAEPGNCKTDPFGPNPGDLEALLSHDLRRFVSEKGFELTNYAGLKRRQEGAHARR